ncbi:MAG: hypothetical protein Q4C54_10470 [Clostridia bacterium]|nr:hypothetical protein [Clostridia bacterium]
MQFNVRLRQSFIYEDCIEAATSEEAEAIARKNSESDGYNWIPEGRLKTISIDETDQVLNAPIRQFTTDEELKDFLTNEVLSFIFGEGDDDDDFTLPVIAVDD